MTDRHLHHIETAREALHRARKHLSAEISAYPAPISGCDAQFNHLLAERQKIANALSALSEPVFVPTPRSPSVSEGVESR
ncbi:MAG: hypothetical protein LJE68_04550 [Rhodobacter sp.]|nr:hypothetical protein [Rhodobacter sp.]